MRIREMMNVLPGEMRGSDLLYSLATSTLSSRMQMERWWFCLDIIFRISSRTLIGGVFVWTYSSVQAPGHVSMLIYTGYRDRGREAVGEVV